MASEYLTVSAHLLPIYDHNGDLVYVHELCSDQCHRELAQTLGMGYGGWFGCQEVFGPAWCSNCEAEL